MVRTWEPNAGVPSTLDKLGGLADNSYSLDDLATWPVAGQGRGILRGVRGGKVVGLVDDSSVSAVVASAIANGRVYWLSAGGAGQVSSGVYDSQRIDSAPIPANWGDPLVPTKGASLGPGVASTDLHVRGDYAAFMSAATKGSPNDLVVVRLSDGKIWRLRTEPGAYLARVLAVTDNEIVALHQFSQDAGFVEYGQRITAYRTDALDSLAAAW
jgi:hypothetical protein